MRRPTVSLRSMNLAMMLSVVYMVGRPVPLYFERFRMIASMIR